MLRCDGRNQRKSGLLPAFSSSSEVFASTLPGHYFPQPLLLLAARFLLGVFLVIRALRSVRLARIGALRIPTRRRIGLRWLFGSSPAGGVRRRTRCGRRRRSIRG